MTYCVGVKLETGMVFASDSRTNAGVDQIASFRKMAVFERPNERVLILLSAGNLAVSQVVVRNMEGLGLEDKVTLYNTPSIWNGAELVGECLRDVRARDGNYLKENNIESSASFILGGQIQGQPQELFLIYPEGNFIGASTETPYFQIGETKYGKPILDRVINHETDLQSASKCFLVSFDSTMRSNLSVGLPIDLLVYKNNSLKVEHRTRIKEGDAYWGSLHQQWNQGIQQLFSTLPDPTWENPA